MRSQISEHATEMATACPKIILKRSSGIRKLLNKDLPRLSTFSEYTTKMATACPKTILKRSSGFRKLPNREKPMPNVI